MGRWRHISMLLTTLSMGLMVGCELGWEFLKVGKGSVGAQTGCQNSRVAIGQFPSVGGLLSSGTFTADYSSPSFNQTTSDKALGLKMSRHRLWLNDLSIEVSFFPVDDTERDPRNGCVGRAILEINIPAEDLFFDNRTIDLITTRPSQTEPSAFYSEGGDPGFTASTVAGTIRLTSVDGGRLRGAFSLTFNPGSTQRIFANGELEDEVVQNPAAAGP